MKGGKNVQSEQFYSDNIDKIYKFFYINCFDVKTAEDLTSQTFLAFIEKSDNDVLNPQKYLYGIMRNVWLLYLRDKYDHTAHTVDIDEDFETYAEKAVSEYENKATDEKLQELVNKLPEKQRQVIIMKYFHNMNVKDIAQELQKDKNYVKTTVKRGLKTLRNVLSSPLNLEADNE